MHALNDYGPSISNAKQVVQLVAGCLPQDLDPTQAELVLCQCGCEILHELLLYVVDFVWSQNGVELFVKVFWEVVEVVDGVAARGFLEDLVPSRLGVLGAEVESDYAWGVALAQIHLLVADVA